MEIDRERELLLNNIPKRICETKKERINNCSTTVDHLLACWCFYWPTRWCSLIQSVGDGTSTRVPASSSSSSLPHVVFDSIERVKKNAFSFLRSSRRVSAQSLANLPPIVFASYRADHCNSSPLFSFNSRFRICSCYFVRVEEARTLSFPSFFCT